MPVFKSDLTGLTLPANAEIIAEGFIDPNELMEEGPFGEYTGYYSGNKGKDYPKPVLRIKRILHRNKPVMWSTTVGKPINDIHMIQSLNRTAAALARPGDDEGAGHPERVLPARGHAAASGSWSRSSRCTRATPITSATR